MKVTGTYDFEVSDADMEKAVAKAAEKRLSTDPDLVQVVRCKDCKYFLCPTKNNFTVCSYAEDGGMLAPKPNDFCNYGERRTDDED